MYLLNKDLFPKCLQLLEKTDGTSTILWVQLMLWPAFHMIPEIFILNGWEYYVFDTSELHLAAFN